MTEKNAADKEILELLKISGNLKFDYEDLLLSIEQAAERIGVSEQTLRNWEVSGKLLPHSKTEKGHRRYLESQVNEFKKKQLSATEFLLPEVTYGKLRTLFCNALFSETEKVDLSIFADVNKNKVYFKISSNENMTEITQAFNIKE